MRSTKLFALSVITGASLALSTQPAQAFDWVNEGVQIFKDNAERIRSRTVGPMFDQKFVAHMGESQVQALQARYGGDWQYKVDTWCNKAVHHSKYGGPNATVAGLTSTWRPHGSSSGGQGINCFARTRNF